MDNPSEIGFGDNVKVIESEITIQKGLAGRLGEIYGETVPSFSGTEVIGVSKHDFALNVYFEELDESFWFIPELLELINHNEGLNIRIGDKEWIRNSKGEWMEPKKTNKILKSFYNLFKWSKS